MSSVSVLIVTTESLETVTPDVDASPHTLQGRFSSFSSISSFTFHSALPTAQGSNFEVMVYSCSRLRIGGRGRRRQRASGSRQPSRPSPFQLPDESFSHQRVGSRSCCNCKVRATPSWIGPLDDCFHLTWTGTLSGHLDSSFRPKPRLLCLSRVPLGPDGISALRFSPKDTQRVRKIPFFSEQKIWQPASVQNQPCVLLEEPKKNTFWQIRLLRFGPINKNTRIAAVLCGDFRNTYFILENEKRC